MSETYVNLMQWLVVISFFVFIGVSMFAEATWLSKKGWTNFGRAFVFSAVSNFIAFAIGVSVFFVVLMVFMMLSLDGSLSKMSKTTTVLGIALVIFAALLTPILLVIGKRIFLGVLKIQTGKPAWLYALVSSVLIFVFANGVPTMVGYFIGQLDRFTPAN